MRTALVCALVAVLAFSLVSAALPAAANENGQGNGGERVLSKVTFIHWKKNLPAKPPGTPGGKNKSGSCYNYIANGAKWRTQEPYAINPTNGDSLSELFVVGSNEAGVVAWEAHAGDQLGDSYVNYSASYNDDYLDGVNTVSFGYYPNSGVIAVTTVWGYFSGPPSQREIVEFDLLYNDPYFVWGNADENPSVMDLQNIATHELGHGLGMGDLYNSECTEQTMYGYSTEGETKKRTPEAGDIAGITKLYS
ncbi:hypothetical protein COT29_03970 [Candidatus Micrarchaeota archaeon CG08_land_8_20_14_0_20_59_11]|nr:MAG: hypothetical protein COT29_03970 [Candidatus Micrarchaeota archaeon CG08_land_8_20_14_0_20_59_11]